MAVSSQVSQIKWGLPEVPRPLLIGAWVWTDGREMAATQGPPEKLCNI